MSHRSFEHRRTNETDALLFSSSNVLRKLVCLLHIDIEIKFLFSRYFLVWNWSLHRPVISRGRLLLILHFHLLHLLISSALKNPWWVSWASLYRKINLLSTSRGQRNKKIVFLTWISESGRWGGLFEYFTTLAGKKAKRYRERARKWTLRSLNCHFGFFSFLHRKPPLESEIDNVAMMEWGKLFNDGLLPPYLISKSRLLTHLGVTLLWLRARKLLIDWKNIQFVLLFSACYRRRRVGSKLQQFSICGVGITWHRFFTADNKIAFVWCACCWIHLHKRK